MTLVILLFLLGVKAFLMLMFEVIKKIQSHFPKIGVKSDILVPSLLPVENLFQ